MRPLLAVAALSAFAASSAAQEAPAPACPTTDASLPAEWANWTKPAPLTAATAPVAETANLTVGRAAAVRLSNKVSFANPPEKVPSPGSQAGLLSLTVEQAGRYAIALGAGAWLDVVGGGAMQADVAHAHGPDCTSIRKIVEFDLKPGRYVVQISGAPTAEVRAMVIRRR